jgi:hypothetical protein
LGFLPALNPGLADATYYFGFSASNALITANGTFFTFAVVIQPGVRGTGMRSLNPTNGGFVAAFDVNNNPVDIAPGTDLPFSVGSAVSVPEPSSLMAVAIVLIPVLGLFCFTRLRRRLATRHPSGR